MLVVPIKGRADLDKLTRAQMAANHFPGLMAKYIQWLINNKERISSPETFQLIMKKSREFEVEHNRVRPNLALNWYAWQTVAECFGLEDLSETYDEAIQSICSYMNILTKAETAASTFTSLVFDLLSTGQYYLEGVSGEENTFCLGEGAIRIGFISPKCVYLHGSSAISAANSLRQRLVGSPIRYSAQAIYDQLERDGVLIPTPSGPSYVYKHPSGGSHRVIRLKRGVVELNDPSEANPEFEESEIRRK